MPRGRGGLAPRLDGNPPRGRKLAPPMDALKTQARQVLPPGAKRPPFRRPHLALLLEYRYGDSNPGFRTEHWL